VLGIQFIAEGLERGEPGIVAMFEELPDELASLSITLPRRCPAKLRPHSTSHVLRDDLPAAPTAVIEEERTRLGEVDGAVSFWHEAVSPYSVAFFFRS
jgi:hypothetical protein